MLIRIHHLIIDEEPKLFISDLLFLFSTRSHNTKKSVVTSNTNKQSPFDNQLDKYQCISNLYSRISIGLVNRWNEFIYRYDPLESADNCDKKLIEGLWQLYSVILIMVVAIISDFIKGYNATQRNVLVKWKFFKNLVRREINKRNLSGTTVWNAIANSMDPLNFLKNYLKMLLFFTIETMTVPFYIYREILAFKSCWSLGHCGYHKSMVGFLFEYIPLLCGAIKETIRIYVFALTAPKKVMDEIFDDSSKSEH